MSAPPGDVTSPLAVSTQSTGFVWLYEKPPPSKFSSSSPVRSPWGFWVSTVQVASHDSGNTYTSRLLCPLGFPTKLLLVISDRKLHSPATCWSSSACATAGPAIATHTS